MKTYRIYVDPNEDIDTTIEMNSAVKNPAMESNFIAFSKDKVAFEFNDIQQNIVGVAIEPNKVIPRVGNGGEKYNVIFEAEDIKNMAYLYGKNLSWNKLNFEHNQKNMAQSAVMYLSYIIDRKNGINPPEAFSDYPDGTWILGYHFYDKEEYNFVKENFIGWSVEGVFLLEEKFKNKNKMSKKERNVIDALRDLFTGVDGQQKETSTEEVTLNSATLEDGTVLVWDGDLEEGVTAVFVQTEEGDVPAPDGEHRLEDGTLLITEGGILQSIVSADKEEEMQYEGVVFSAVVLELFEKQTKNIEELTNSITELKKEIEELKKSAPQEPSKKKFTRGGEFTHLTGRQVQIFKNLKNK